MLILVPRWQNLAIALASKACVRKDFSVQIGERFIAFANESPGLGVNIYKRSFITFYYEKYKIEYNIYNFISNNFNLVYNKLYY